MGIVLREQRAQSIKPMSASAPNAVLKRTEFWQMRAHTIEKVAIAAGVNPNEATVS
ncbi:hypothetical protein [Bosea vaviloviae]|uniref:hypothetical protein n=1 Tax=Bosea vaviloviae TaxID=1526658 RepID=UPI000AF7127B|nr:hypothetical protein [Bosea vaviloviae]